MNAELLIDHAWGWEPCTVADVKAYRPQSSSISSGQVLHCPYTAEKARLVVQEMADLLALELVEKGLVTDRMVLTVGYDIENLRDPGRRRQYRGAVTADHYGRQVPKHAHGTANIGRQTSSARLILQAVLELYDRIVDPSLLVRRVNVTAAHLALEDPAAEDFVQMELFADDAQREQEKEREALRKERQVQQMQLEIKRRFGKNAILRGMSLQEGATARDRNRQIGGHRA